MKASQTRQLAATKRSPDARPLCRAAAAQLCPSPVWKSTTEMCAHEVFSSGSTSATSGPIRLLLLLGRDEFSRPLLDARRGSVVESASIRPETERPRNFDFRTGLRHGLRSDRPALRGHGTCRRRPVRQRHLRHLLLCERRSRAVWPSTRVARVSRLDARRDRADQAGGTGDEESAVRLSIAFEVTVPDEPKVRAAFARAEVDPLIVAEGVKVGG